MGKLINGVPGPRLLISSLPGSALRMLVELLGLSMSTSVLEALPGKLDIKRHLPSILYIYCRQRMNYSSNMKLPIHTRRL